MFAMLVRKFQRKEYFESLKKNIEFEEYLFSLCFHGDRNVSDPELKLSLSTGEDSRRKGSLKRTWSDKEAGPCTQIIINLEDSSERVSNEGERDGLFFKCAALKTHSGGKHEPEFSVRNNKHLPDVIAASHSVLGDGKCCKNQNSLSKGTVDL